MPTKSGSLHFFATLDDYINTISCVDDIAVSKYMVYGQQRSSLFASYESILQIPNVGISPNGDINKQATWQIVGRFDVPKIVERTLSDGTRTYDPKFDSMLLLQPSGLYADNTMIGGNLYFGSDDEQTILRFKQYSDAIRKNFTRVRAFWIGPYAMKLFDSGIRFTLDIQAPEACNLSRPT